MDYQETASTVLGNAVVDWLAEEALLESEPATLYDELCRRLRAIGMPRAAIAYWSLACTRSGWIS